MASSVSERYGDVQTFQLPFCQLVMGCRDRGPAERRREMKLGNQHGSYLEDEIDLVLSPFDLEQLVILTKVEALKTDSYTRQGIWRNIKDYLQERFDTWQNERNEKDKKEAK